MEIFSIGSLAIYSPLMTVTRKFSCFDHEICFSTQRNTRSYSGLSKFHLKRILDAKVYSTVGTGRGSPCMSQYVCTFAKPRFAFPQKSNVTWNPPGADRAVSEITKAAELDLATT